MEQNILRARNKIYLSIYLSACLYINLSFFLSVYHNYYKIYWLFLWCFSGLIISFNLYLIPNFHTVYKISDVMMTPNVLIWLIPYVTRQTDYVSVCQGTTICGKQTPVLQVNLNCFQRMYTKWVYKCAYSYFLFVTQNNVMTIKIFLFWFIFFY